MYRYRIIAFGVIGGFIILAACSTASPTPASTRTIPSPVPPTKIVSPTIPSPNIATASVTAEASELNPSPRGYITMAYDSESKQIILFGGQTGDMSSYANYNNETWAFDVSSNTWKNMKPLLSPPGGSAGALVYDLESDRVILFGSTRGVQPSGDVWVYDYNTNTWTKMNSRGPILRLGIRMAYDVESDRIVAFGGYNVNRDQILEDTWVYDFNSDTWVNMEPAINPPGRNYHSMTYDVKRDRVVLWGGDGDTMSSRQPKDPSIWAYDFNTNTWEQMMNTDGPDGRAYHAIDYDTEADRIVMYGGYTIGWDDTWVYDFNTNSWKNLEPELNPDYLTHWYLKVVEWQRA